MGSLDEYTASVGATRNALSLQPNLQELVRFASLAASGHNTQPWRFRLLKQQVQILPDWLRQTPIVDPDDHHLFVSLGCAAENLMLSAAARGLPGELTFEAASGGSLRFCCRKGGPTDSALFQAIPWRQSTRNDYSGRAASGHDLQTLRRTAESSAVDLLLLTDRSQMEQILELVLASNEAQLRDAAFLKELKGWLRFNPHQALATNDGLFSAASGMPVLPTWLGPKLFDLLLNKDAENKKYASQIRSSAGIAVFVSQKDDAEHWALAGRACQRFTLQATALGMKCAYINQPVEDVAVRPQLAALLGPPGRRPDLVLRFGYGKALPYSSRRPVKDLLA